MAKYTLYELQTMSAGIDTSRDNVIVVNDNLPITTSVKKEKLKELTNSELKKFGVVIQAKKVRKKLRCFANEDNDELARKSSEELAANIADTLCDSYIFGFKSGRLYLYDGEYGCFVLCSTKGDNAISLKRLIMNLRDAAYNKFALRDNIIAKVADILMFKEGVCKKLDNQRDNIINLQNGVFDLKTRTLLPHDPKYHCLYCINACYYPDLSVTNTSRAFLEHLSGYSEENFKCLMQILGLALSNVRRYQSAALIVGPPSCGKSLFTEFIKAILSKGAVKAVEIASFKKRTDRVDLENAQVGICTDFEGGTISAKAVAVFKQVVAGETINARHLYQDSSDITPNLFLIFCGNELPTIEDDSNAFERRILSVFTGNTIPEDQRNPDMLELLLNDRDAIVSTALNYVSNVYNGLDFLVRNKLKLTKRSSDPNTAIKHWFKENVVPCDDETITISSLHSDFCEKNGELLELNGFGMRLKRIFPDLETAKKKGVNTLLGYKLKDVNNDVTPPAKDVQVEN